MAFLSKLTSGWSRLIPVWNLTPAMYYDVVLVYYRAFLKKIDLWMTYDAIPSKKMPINLWKQWRSEWGGMDEQCPGAPEVKGAPKDRQKEKEKEENWTKREGQGPQRVYCPRTPNVHATPPLGSLSPVPHGRTEATCIVSNWVSQAG